MTEQPFRDRWAEWLLERRFGGDEGQRKAFLEGLLPWRDRILKNAAAREGDTLLDVGAGDGLIAFEALDLVGQNGRVIFLDISRDLLDYSRKLAEEMGVVDRCEFLLAPADDLSALEDASVDTVTTRSVLIYVKDKRRAFEEFHRVLRPGGRISLFEPINRFKQPQPSHLFLGYDVTPVQEIARKVTEVFRRIQPMETDPMLNFDERDLFDLAENAGFAEVHLNYEASLVSNDAYFDVTSWEVFVRSAGNPRIPALEEAMDETLTPEEIERFTAHLRPLVENARRRGTSAIAYLWAVKW
ncbi:MAG: class I SAM-dependent methyltransferase [Actinomycetota bacterium]|nr:class I SAM-dependent methyltransferase [Actinomycetota bacterium]